MSKFEVGDWVRYTPANAYQGDVGIIDKITNVNGDACHEIRWTIRRLLDGAAYETSCEFEEALEWVDCEIPL